MPNIKLTDIEMKYIFLLESLTGAIVKDCIIDEGNDRLIFLVKKGQVGMAVGKNGTNIRKTSKLTGRNIEVVEYADTLEELIKNSLFPAKIRSMRTKKDSNERKVVVVSVTTKEKGLAIGKGGKNISRARILAERYFDVDWVSIA